MFGKSAEPAVRSTGGEKHNQSILQDGVVIRGEVEAKGDVRLDGRLEGKIRVTERLTIGTGGAVKAEVEASEVIVMGKFEGTIRAKRRLELRKGAHVVGDVSTPCLIIEEGVHFEGNSKMGDSTSQKGLGKAGEGEILSLNKKGPNDLSKAVR